MWPFALGVAFHSVELEKVPFFETCCALGVAFLSWRGLCLRSLKKLLFFELVVLLACPFDSSLLCDVCFALLAWPFPLELEKAHFFWDLNVSTPTT